MFEKVYGATEAQEGLTRIGRNKYEARFGFGTDSNGNSYDWRKQYKGAPTIKGLKTEILETIDAITDEAILTGFQYNGSTVYLSMENQFNYKAAYDLAIQMNGATLPITIKLGETDSPVYVEFTTLDDFSDFYTSALAHIQAQLKQGWERKDNIDWTKFEINE